MSDHQPETVTATEIAAWVYCPEQWRLAAIGQVSENRAALDRGTARHRELASIERRTRHAAAGRKPSLAPRRSGCAVALLQLAVVVGTAAVLFCCAVS